MNASHETMPVAMKMMSVIDRFIGRCFLVPGLAAACLGLFGFGRLQVSWALSVADDCDVVTIGRPGRRTGSLSLVARLHRACLLALQVQDGQFLGLLVGDPVQQASAVRRPEGLVERSAGIVCPESLRRTAFARNQPQRLLRRK